MEKRILHVSEVPYYIFLDTNSIIKTFQSRAMKCLFCTLVIFKCVKFYVFVTLSSIVWLKVQPFDFVSV